MQPHNNTKATNNTNRELKRPCGSNCCWLFFGCTCYYCWHRLHDWKTPPQEKPSCWISQAVSMQQPQEDGGRVEIYDPGCKGKAANKLAIQLVGFKKNVIGYIFSFFVLFIMSYFTLFQMINSPNWALSLCRDWLAQWNFCVFPWLFEMFRCYHHHHYFFLCQ